LNDADGNECSRQFLFHLAIEQNGEEDVNQRLSEERPELRDVEVLRVFASIGLKVVVEKEQRNEDADVDQTDVLEVVRLHL